ncbi:uncharacterized protein J8A68_002031 [[Candida] subhashii]|uniref:Golgi pH regulator n=1 Tax=[Candida] subhashii TaxID=561895 RepID=A0A8J5UJB8_9ASCO|nr:uncharacterized protein J8A68_002031 [[Candida] subhashii]KAG7664428.1 hypothetical protein J8A68_002031 [[Candida] subhashii]
MSVFSILSYLTTISSVFIWTYTFVYNKNIIPKYSNSLHVPKARINEYLENSIRKKYGLNLMQVNVEENSEYDYNSDKPSNGNSSRTRLDIVKHSFVGILFSLTISLSIGLITLMMCELADYFDVGARLMMFKFTIDSLMFLLVFLLPIGIINLFVSQDIFPRSLKSKRMVLVGLIFVGWLYILHKSGDLTQTFTPRTSQSTNIKTRNMIERKINEVSIVGITVLAILSGIGCTSTPYRVFSLSNYMGRLILGKSKELFNESKQKKEIGEGDINSAIQYFNNTSSLLTKRKLELNRLLTEKSGSIYNLSNGNSSRDNILSPKKNKHLGSLFHKVQSFANLSMLNGNSEEDELKKEIDSFIALRNSLYDDLIRIIARYRKQQASKTEGTTLIVKTLYWGNILFGIYCIYRIINVFAIKLPWMYLYGNDLPENIADDSETPTSKDALAITLAKVILSIFSNLPVSKAQLVNQLSFVLSGSLFICSFSNVLFTFKSFSRLIPTSHASEAIKSWLKHVVIAELVGIYVISTALLIRTNLPANLSNQISKILSLSGSAISNPNVSIREVMFIDNWFDKIFALSCVVTLIVIVIKRVVDEDEINPYSQDEYDEESFIEGTEYKLA